MPLVDQWRNVGVLLNLPESTLGDIEQEHDRINDCLREMLYEWLKQANPTPTWSILSEAIEPLKN